MTNDARASDPVAANAWAAFMASAATFYPRAPYVTSVETAPTAAQRAAASDPSTAPNLLARLAGQAPREILANPAAGADVRDAARAALANGSITAELGRVDERARGRWLLECVEHALRTHVRIALGSDAPVVVCAAIRALLDGAYQPSARFAVEVAALQALFDRIEPRAKASGDQAERDAASTLYLVGALASHFHTALQWFEADLARRPRGGDAPGSTWFAFRTESNRWYPLWHVLDGCAAVGGVADRERAAERFAQLAVPTPTG